LRPRTASWIRRPARALIAGGLLASSLVAAAAHGAVVLEGKFQGSASNTDNLGDTVVTVGAAPNRLLVIGVSVAGSATSVQSISWRGLPASPLFAQSTPQGSRSCRLELWRLVDPPAGTGFLAVQLSASTAFGVGVAEYSGVDLQRPTSLATLVTGNASPVQVSVGVPDGRPMVGIACLGGMWMGGRVGGNGPDAVAAPGDTSLWDFTENGVVGLGSHSAAVNGIARVRWDITFANPLVWLAAGVSITPQSATPEDAGVDARLDAGVEVAPDLRLPDDPAPLPTDLGPPLDQSPDQSPDNAAVDLASDPAAMPEAAVDEAAVDQAVSPMLPDTAPIVTADAAADLPPLGIDPDGGDIHDANFIVGCACRTGGRGAGGSALGLVLLAAVIARRRARRSR
jgi:hypothetical protein